MTNRLILDGERNRVTDASGNLTPKGTLRRRLLVGSGAMAVSVNPTLARSEDNLPIAQPPVSSPSAFMDSAFEMRQIAVDRGDQAYGAVIVLDDLIVGQSWSRVILDSDPTGHAEMSAIRDAARRLNRRDLSGATMFSSSRPCAMCEAAAYWAGIGRMVHGRSLKDAGRPGLCG